MKEIQEQLPKIVSETVDRYMNSKSVEVKVDEGKWKPRAFGWEPDLKVEASQSGRYSLIIL